MHQLNMSASIWYREHPRGHGQNQWALGKAGDCFRKDTIRRLLAILLKLLHELLSQIRPFSWSFPLCSLLLEVWGE